MVPQRLKMESPMARRARASRDRNTATAGAPASPWIQRTLPFFDVLDEEKLVRLEAQVDWIFEEVGIAFRDDPEALRIWKEAGAKIDGGHRAG